MRAMYLASRLTATVVSCFGIALIVLSSAGCSGRPRNFAKSVTGKVTLGGQPLAGASVVFTPVGGGSPSTGRTDESGNYNLVWGRRGKRGIEGAQIGDHSVSISTFMDEVPSMKPPRPGTPEKVPYKYRLDSQPKVTVKAGANVIDIPLEAGPVDAPVAKGKGKKK
jgi:hypothetical protein